MAAEFGHKDIVEPLINNGADVKNYSNTAPRAAEKKGRQDIVELSRQHGAVE